MAPEIPGGLNPTEYLTKLESGELPDVSAPLTEQLGSFLADDSQALLLLVGEAGCGKSMFSWLLAQRCSGTVVDGVRVPTAHATTVHGYQLPWVPVVLDMLRFKAMGRASETHAGLEDCLAHYLVKDCALSAEVVGMLDSGKPFAEGPLLRLLVVCDGFDELQGVADGIHGMADFVSILRGGRAWSNCTVKVVVTSRDGRLTHADEERVFPGRVRRVLLPFGDSRVSESLIMAAAVDGNTRLIS